MYQPEYTNASDAIKAIDLAIEDTIKDNPELGEDDIYHEMAQSIMLDCDEDTAREVARRTGVPYMRL